MSTANPTRTKDTPAEPSARLKPKEHGAYAILAIPAVTALAVTGPTVAGLGVAIASIAGFFAHEPLLVSLGHRGLRAQRTTPAASRRLLALSLLVAASGCTALIVGSPEVRWGILACLLTATTSFSLAVAGKHRTLSGQLIGVAGLSAPCVPILLAGNITAAITLETWASWLIGFSATTLAVRGVIAAQKRRPKRLYWTFIAALTLLAGFLIATGFRLPIVTLPMLIMSWYLLIFPPPARHLKRVGWTLVVGTVTSAIWMTFLMT